MPEPQATDSLPIIDLQRRSIPTATLHFIPLSTVEKYQVVAFEVTDDLLKLAIVYPEQLKKGFIIALDEIGRKVGKKVELYKTDTGSMQKVIKDYRHALEQQAAPPPLPSTPKKELIPPPPLFEVGKTVVYNYLRRVPFDFAERHRLVCVDHFPPSTYWFAMDKETAESHRSALAYIEQHNKIKAYPVFLEKKDFDQLLEYYRAKVEELKKAELDQKKNEAKAELEAVQKEVQAEEQAMDSGEPVKLAKDVIVPQVPAKIITSEEEKSGLAGIMQRMAQSLATTKPTESEEEIAASAPVTPSAPNIPPSILPQPSVPAPDVTTEEKKESVPTSPEPEAKKVEPAPTDTESKPSSQRPDVQPALPPAVKPEAKPAPHTSEDSADIGKLIEKTVETKEELTEYIRKGFIPRIVAAIVNFAIHEKASDVHIEVFSDEVRVRYRIDGQLIDIVKLPPDVHAAIVSRIKILSKLRLDETRVPQDGRFDVNFNEAQVDVRVSIMPTVHGEKVVMRILDKSKSIASLDGLGLEGLGYDNLIKAIKKPYGICLATGPTGSGKSTSLYAILGMVATPNVNVTTLEDPVEYEMKGINQSQIRPKIGFTFAEGLRSILRQDPNIIMVGEIRDGETANMATQSALTGHLVLSTLHTNDAAGAIPRLNNMGIEPFLITSSLNVVMGQRLVRKICDNCKEKVNIPDGVRARIEGEIAEIRKLNPEDAKRIPETIDFFQGAGCPQCEGKGYKGRIGIYEVLPMSDLIEELTLKKASATDIQQAAQKEGMVTMYQDGLIKVTNGITTLDEVLRETTN